MDKPTEKLIEDINLALHHLEMLKKNAEDYCYHDFRAESPTPKMLLRNHVDLVKLGLEEINLTMLKGDYDNDPSPEDEEYMINKLKQ